jgi:uncharacterized membrane protein
MTVVEKRNIATWILLSIVTCGICHFVWIYKMNEEINAMKNSNLDKRSSATVVLLSIVTCNIYAIYWYYVVAQDLTNISREMNTTNQADNAIAVLVCGIFCPVISMGILQNQLNEIIDFNLQNSRQMQ